MKKIIPFDLEKALAGAQVVTRGGKNTPSIPLERDDWHWFKNSDDECCVHTSYNSHTIEGYIYTGKTKTTQDLMLEVDTTTVEGWINIYQCDLHPTKEKAVSYAGNCIGQVFIQLEGDK